MAPYNKPVTLSDIENRGNLMSATSFQIPGVAGSNTTWNISIGLWLVIVVAANVLHPPALVMLVLNAALLVFNLDQVRRVGRENTPIWLFFIIAMQALVTLNYASFCVQMFV